MGARTAGLENPSPSPSRRGEVLDKETGEVVDLSSGEVVRVELSDQQHYFSDWERQEVRFKPRTVEERAYWNRIKKRGAWLSEEENRRLLSFAEKLCEELGLPTSIAAEALRYAKLAKVAEKAEGWPQRRKGASLAMYVAAAIYYLAEDFGYPVTLQRVLEVASKYITIRRVGLVIWFVKRKFGYKPSAEREERYLRLFLRRLFESEELEGLPRRTLEGKVLVAIAEKARELLKSTQWGGERPATKVATCIYVALRMLFGDTFQLSSVAEVTKVSESAIAATFRRRFRNLGSAEVTEDGDL